MSSERSEHPAAPDRHGVPGKTLAAEREAMGWTVEQVADQLKLAVRQVIALEAGDYASLPGPAVVRGFVRAYAKILKLDAAPLVAMIALDTPATSESGSGAMRRDKPASFSEVRFPSYGRRATLPLGWIGGAVLVLAAAAAAWKFGLIPSSLPRSEAPAAAASGSAMVLPPPVTGSAGSGAQQQLQSTSVPLISVPPPAAAPAAGAAAGATAPAPAAANALVINVREDSWIEVTGANGVRLIARLVKAGNTETFELTEPVTLVVGKPDAVSASLRGEALALPLAAGKKFSRVKLR
jgi:cytoskeleton protein RodZ